MTHSRRWLEKHKKDPYVKQAQKKGYHSRAAFKLLEIHKRYNLFKVGMGVVDLGAAPGGWSQVTKNCVGTKGVVIALDLLPMRLTADIESIQGDFNKKAVFNQLQEMIIKKF